MKKRAIIAVCVALLVGTPSANGQGFLKGLKKLGEKIEKTLESNTSSNCSKEGNNSKSNLRQGNNSSKRVQSNDGNMEDEKPTVRLPEQHTALFEPLGYPAEPTYGTKSIKPVVPPVGPSKQVAWVDKMPNPRELDNYSLVAELKMLETSVEDGIIERLSPADHRLETIRAIVLERCNALNKFVELYNDVKDEYKDPEAYNWVINGSHRNMAEILGGNAYKTLIRSSLEPLFSPTAYINDDTKAYFAAHGGYENALNVKWTKWDPEPNKKEIGTSNTGTKGKVLSENGSGAHVDIDGIIYILHNNGYRAFMSELATTAVAGKDIVIPDYVEYNGKKYAVESMRGGLFSNTKIKSVKLPATLDEIPNGAFRNTAITEIVIPASVKVVQGSAFFDCKNLTKVVFESECMDAVHGCFQNCVKLQSIVFPKKLKEGMSYDMFRGCTSLTNVTLPDNLQSIPSHMFCGCKSLKSISIPMSVKKIDDSAFDDCPITTLSIPGVNEIDEGTFSDCKTLKALKINSTLKAKLIEDNFWLYVTNFGDNPYLKPKLTGNTVSVADGIVVIE